MGGNLRGIKAEACVTRQPCLRMAAVPDLGPPLSLILRSGPKDRGSKDEAET
jgi:hypothetical protein